MKWLNEKKGRQYLLALLILLIGATLSSLILLQPWNTVYHTVSFYDQNGELTESCRVKDGSAVIPPAIFLEGYRFKDWSGQLHKVTGDMEVYPLFSEVGTERNVIYADTVYNRIDKPISVIPTISGTVDTCGFEIEMGFDSELLRFKDAEPIIEGITITQESEGLLILRWSSERSLKAETQLARITFEATVKDGAYGTTIPFLTREIYRQDEGDRVYTDSTAYDAKLYIYK